MQFGLEEILTLMEKMEQTGLSGFVYRDQETEIRLKGKKAPSWKKARSQEKQTEIAEKEICEEKEENLKEVLCPMVGTFYAAPSQDDDPFISVGDTVKKGQVIGIVEAMKLMNEIRSEYSGVVEEILVQNEQLVEYEQPLIRIRQ
ncbi:MAG TPA: acetyl-CoA carboxylase biotin carboxyl carrier protein [Candidatus Choladousia intestinigallinarum]|nr:acetyl-CoA carboxylase biotin carboxyl carrier protein [Candidatus Choladousia intestinigallinarum]